MVSRPRIRHPPESLVMATAHQRLAICTWTCQNTTQCHRCLGNAWLQQDSAPVCFGKTVPQFLNERFSRKSIGRGFFLPWPPRSSDLTLLDCGCVKNIVYQEETAHLPTVRHRTTETTETVTEIMLQQDRASFRHVSSN